MKRYKLKEFEEWAGFNAELTAEKLEKTKTQRPSRSTLRAEASSMAQADDIPLSIINPVQEITKYTGPIERQSKKEDWSATIRDLQTFFATANIPVVPTRLDQCTTVDNPAKFIESHLATISNNNGNPAFRPYLTRLNQFKTLLK